jgi:hypothetical protein
MTCSKFTGRVHSHSPVSANYGIMLIKISATLQTPARGRDYSPQVLSGTMARYLVTLNYQIYAASWCHERKTKGFLLVGRRKLCGQKANSTNHNYDGSVDCNTKIKAQRAQSDPEANFTKELIVLYISDTKPVSPDVSVWPPANFTKETTYFRLVLCNWPSHRSALCEPQVNFTNESNSRPLVSNSWLVRQTVMAYRLT